MKPGRCLQRLWRRMGACCCVSGVVQWAHALWAATGITHPFPALLCSAVKSFEARQSQGALWGAVERNSHSSPNPQLVYGVRSWLQAGWCVQANVEGEKIRTAQTPLTFNYLNRPQAGRRAPHLCVGREQEHTEPRVHGSSPHSTHHSHTPQPPAGWTTCASSLRWTRARARRATCAWQQPTLHSPLPHASTARRLDDVRLIFASDASKRTQSHVCMANDQGVAIMALPGRMPEPGNAQCPCPCGTPWPGALAAGSCEGPSRHGPWWQGK